ERVKQCKPGFFEELVIDLLLKMGYGGSRADAGSHLGRPGDGGIDGIIKEDALGLDVVCIQAKRWQGTVGRGEVAQVSGSMDARRANKGVLITTSSFSDAAMEFIDQLQRRVVLIDGPRLTELMIDHGIGVQIAQTYHLKKLDVDYFTEEEGE